MQAKTPAGRPESAPGDDPFDFDGDLDPAGPGTSEGIRLNKFLAQNGVASRRGADELIAKGHVVAIGFAQGIGNVPRGTTKKDLTMRMREAHPEWKEGKVTGSASQLWLVKSTIAHKEGSELPDELRSVPEKAQQFIEDALGKLDWEEMQETVAGILRAMGYKTRVAARGADRGVDIFASPDGLGLQEPRIFAEVKHREGAMGANAVRSFMGGRKEGDRCLYVSTGGFSKEARYEAERSNIPLTLVALPELRELLVEHYEKLDEEIRRLVPLRRIYLPADGDQ